MESSYRIRINKKLKKILKIYAIICSLLIMMVMLNLFQPSEKLDKILSLKQGLYYNYKNKLFTFTHLINEFFILLPWINSFLFTDDSFLYRHFMPYPFLVRDYPFEVEESPKLEIFKSKKFIKSTRIFYIITCSCCKVIPFIWSYISEPCIHETLPIAIDPKTKKIYNIIYLSEFNKMIKKESLSLTEKNILEYIEEYLTKIAPFTLFYKGIGQKKRKSLWWINAFKIFQSKEELCKSFKKLKRNQLKRIEKILKISPLIKKKNGSYKVILFVWNPQCPDNFPSKERFNGILTKWEFLVKTNGEILKCKETVIIDEFEPPALE